MPWYDEPTSVPLLSSAIRSVITAGKGKRMFVSDLSAIEGRIVSWFAEAEWKLKIYRDFDLGIGYDPYILTYAKSFGVSPEEVGKDERRIGKVMELFLGYGGGVGAFLTAAVSYNIDLDELTRTMLSRLPKDVIHEADGWWEESVRRGKTYDLSYETFVTLDSLKRLWRRANPEIQHLWWDMENAAKKVLCNKDCRPVHVRKLTLDKKGNWMRMRLPSGRYLSYPGARVVSNKIRYLGLNTYIRKWCNLSTYGGKLTENATQGFAADVFYNGFIEAEKAGYMALIPVHDEAVTEREDGSAEELSKHLATVPSYAPGLPLAAKGFTGYRYRKD